MPSSKLDFARTHCNKHREAMTLRSRRAKGGAMVASAPDSVGREWVRGNG